MAGKKHAGGRPKLFKSAEELQKRIDAYFNSCIKPVISKDGEVLLDGNGEPVMVQHRPYTIGGLAFALGMTRQTLLNYQKNEQFFDTIMRAKQQCEVYAEEALYYKESVQGAKFTLINNYNGWTDKQEISAVNTNINTDISDLPPEALEEIAKAQGQEEVMRIVSKYRK